MKYIIKHCIVALCLLVSVDQLYAQKQLKIGDNVPADIEMNNIVNYKTTSAKISDFKGRLLILDFWATWCAPCVAAFPKLDAIQKEFDGKIQILPVAYEDGKIVAAFLNKMNLVNHLLPVSVTGEKTLGGLFYHTVVPHYVWINGDSKVVAITDEKQVTNANINKVLSGDLVNFEEKNDSKFSVMYGFEAPAFAPSIRIKQKPQNSIELKRLPDSTRILYSVLTKYVENLTPGMTASRDGSGSFVTFQNRSIGTLYQTALLGLGLEALNRGTLLVDIKDTTLYERITSNHLDGKPVTTTVMENLIWKKENAYSYEISVPPSLEKYRFQIMRDDLNRYFGALLGIEGVTEKREGKYLALIRTSEIDKLASKGGKVEEQVDKFSVKVQNGELDAIRSALLVPLQEYPPIIDETKYKGKVDIELNCNLADLKAINKELARYDLLLVEKKKIMEMAVVRIKKNRE